MLDVGMLDNFYGMLDSFYGRHRHAGEFLMLDIAILDI